MSPKFPQKTQPAPPKGLSRSAKRLWRAVVETYSLESHHLRLLELGCEQITRADQAREKLAGGELTIDDRFGQPKPNPLVEIERQASLAAVRVLRELGLDTESIESTKRGYSRRGA